MQRGFFIDPVRGRNPRAKPDVEVVHSYIVNKEIAVWIPKWPDGWYWRTLGANGEADGGVNGPWPSQEAAIRGCRVIYGTELVERIELYDGKTDLWRERLV